MGRILARSAATRRIGVGAFDAWAWLSAALVAVFIYNTILNNAFVYGATLADGGMFETMMWRGGWELNMAPIHGGASFFRIHFSPLFLIPNALSYVYPGDRLSFFAIVYAVGWGGMAFACYKLLRLIGWIPMFSCLGAVLVPAMQPLFNGSWEPHMEQFSCAFSVMALIAWQRRNYRAVFAWHAAVALMREDFALLFAAPIVLLGLAQYLRHRNFEFDLARERARFVAVFLLVSSLYVFAAFAVQKSYFGGSSVIAANYFDPNQPFAHLTPGLLADRAIEIFRDRIGLWLPLLVLLVAAIVRREIDLLVGAVCFLPFLVVLFLAKFELNGRIATYQAFMLVVSFHWPAVIGLDKPIVARRAYALLQCLVLATTLSYIALRPAVIMDMRSRWFSHHQEYSRSSYNDFRFELQSVMAAGSFRASHGVGSLYPYDFKPWFLSMVADASAADLAALKTLIWFEGDRDRQKVAEILRSGAFDTRLIRGTKLRVSQRREGAGLVASVADSP